jgi:hypothetical protein
VKRSVGTFEGREWLVYPTTLLKKRFFTYEGTTKGVTSQLSSYLAHKEYSIRLSKA